MFDLNTLTGSKAEQYAQLAEMAKALLAGENDRIANAANLSALVYHTVPDLNWVGFYFFDGNELVVGPFQGKPACVRIPLDKGMCGRAARTRQTVRINNVHDEPDHIACDAASVSELVIPLVVGDQFIGVFDIDSPVANRFDDDDMIGMELLSSFYIASCCGG